MLVSNVSFVPLVLPEHQGGVAMSKKRKKVRTSISLSAEVFDRLKGVSEKSGVPISTFVDEALLGALPHLEMMAEAMSHAKSDPARALKLLSDSLDGVVDDVEEKHNKIKEKRSPNEVRVRA